MIVEVKQGRLEGEIKESILTGKEYCSFLGIPYAKPPIGELRFQPPEPVEKWDGILSAKTEGSPCIQKDIFTGITYGSEDCLYLNVYTSAVNKSEKHDKNVTPKAVMVFLHGGGCFQFSGSGDLFSPDYMINYDIVLVTINYRLHVLGFLDMGTKSVAANCGLRDQCLALKWVQENIKQFGGDPENVTLFGESAGGSCVYYHLLSPMSKGLFSKAIKQSDPLYNVYKNENRPIARTAGFEIAKKLGSDETNVEKLVDFLKEQSASDLCEQAIAIMLNAKQEMPGAESEEYIYGPAVDIIKDNAFLPDTVENLTKTATKVPLMVGLCNKEGRMFLALYGENTIKDLENDFSKVILRPPHMDSATFQKVVDKIRKKYLGDKWAGEETFENLVDLYTDYWFRSFYDSMDFITESENPVYIYEFGFSGKFNVIERMLLKDRPPSSSGACHGDDCPYLLYPKVLLPGLEEFPEPEITVIKNMCSLWTNFAKDGNPSANLKGTKWREYSSSKPCYLRINRDLELVEEKLRGEEFDFWLKLLQ